MSAVIKGYLRQNFKPVLCIFIFFIGGLVLGALSTKMLDLRQQGDLLNYFNDFLNQLSSVDFSNSMVVQQVIATHLKLICCIWFLGLTVIGVPLIVALVFARGFVLGFTVGFLVEKKAAQGLILAIFSVLPQNILFIPALLSAAVAAISFSVWLIKGKLIFSQPLLPRLFAYSLILLLTGLLITTGGLVEVYLAPVMIKLILAYF